MNWKLPMAALGLIVLVAGAASLRRVPKPPEFCDRCVMAREVVAWRLAGRWSLGETASIRATPVSALLQRHHELPEHAHQWSAPRYLTESELETPEAPRVRSIGLLNAPRAASFLRDLFDYTDRDTTANWRSIAWQPAYASALEPALRFRRFPEAGFTNRADFLAWWNDSAYPLFNKLHEMTEAD